LAFSPDGKRLAVGSDSRISSTGQVVVWGLDDGRGLRTLRGLTGVVAKAVVSPDGRLVAGLSHDWQVGVWDSETGGLRQVLEVPRGVFADNSALAFSPDGRWFAFAAGRAVTLWDLEAGRLVQAWSIPPGLGDALAFRGPDEVLLLRLETRDGVPPFSEFPFKDHPRVCPLRRLRPGRAEPETVKVLTEFDRHAYIWAVPGGRSFVVAGHTAAEGERCTVGGYDAATGDLRWSFRADRRVLLTFDPTGRVMGYLHPGDREVTLLRVPGLAPAGRLPSGSLLGPGARQWLGGEPPAPEHPFRFLLFDRDRPAPLVRIPQDDPRHDEISQFSPDDRHQVVWGNVDGTVTVCDLREIQRRLAAVGLGW
jgi:hypothetical protein